MTHSRKKDQESELKIAHLKLHGHILYTLKTMREKDEL